MSHSAALTNGIAYAGRATTTGGVPVWQDITNADNPGFPFGKACGITFLGQGGDSYIQVVTTDGKVYQTHGDTNGNDFTWNERWTELTPAPTPPALRGKQFKGDPMRGASRNRLL
ncbi:hypothetical protein [Streptomyces sp. NPDC059874]|uniref:hypothetical protein n=1 Tax=Streptomyces sp. NPDC059874 TaxID=3346983 RepID=UPI003655D47A